MTDAVLVQPVPRRRPVITLVDMALPGAEPTPEQLQQDPRAADRWVGGITWRPELCGGAWGVIDSCVPDDPSVPDVQVIADNPISTLPTYFPVRIYVPETCTTLAARDLPYFVDRVTQALTVATPGLVGREFWDGPITRGMVATGAMASPNPYLAQSGVATDLTPGSGAVSIERGYAILEKFLGQCGFGQQGMIHAPRDCVPTLGVRRPPGSNLLLTDMDTLVVPDPGYSGNGPGNAAPAAGESWIYATGLVTLRMTPPEVMAGGEDWRQVTWTRQNRVEVQAFRYIAPTWDGDCCVGAVRVLLGN
jgi:hypothetical protein